MVYTMGMVLVVSFAQVVGRSARQQHGAKASPSTDDCEPSFEPNREGGGNSDDDHSASWPLFLVGMTGLVICSYAINSVFVAWSQVYSAFLTGVLGAAVFAALHYFVGSIVTSLPELFVATKNIARLRPADLNTALGSASYSNLSNLVIAALGAIAAIIATGFGVRFVL